LKVSSADLSRQLPRSGARILNSMQNSRPSVNITSGSYHIAQHASISFHGQGPLPSDLPSHVFITFKPTEKHKLFAYPTHAPILLGTCAAVDPRMALNATAKLIARSNASASAYHTAFDLQVPTYVMDLPEPMLFPPLHEWMYTRNTLDLITALCSSGSTSKPIPHLPPGYVKLLGASAQPSARAKAGGILYTLMLESFPVEALVLVLNRLRGVKVNAVKLQIWNEDLHETLDGLREAAFYACQDLLDAKPGHGDGKGHGGSVTKRR